MTTHDLVHDGDSWSDAECDAVAAPYITFWNAIKTVLIHSATALVELRFYKGYDGDGSPGEVDYVKTYSLPGSAGTSMLPPQIACTVTEITDSRRRWGRFYIPGISSNVLAADGTMGSSSRTALADAAETMYEAWGGLPGNTTPVVWSNSSHPMSWAVAAPPRWRPTWVVPTGSVYLTPSAFAVQAIRVDEILDTQRPRRYQATQSRITRQLA